MVTERNPFSLLPDPLEAFPGSQLCFLDLYAGSSRRDPGLVCSGICGFVCRHSPSLLPPQAACFPEPPGGERGCRPPWCARQLPTVLGCAAQSGQKEDGSLKTGDRTSVWRGVTSGMGPGHLGADRRVSRSSMGRACIYLQTGAQGLPAVTLSARFSLEAQGPSCQFYFSVGMNVSPKSAVLISFPVFQAQATRPALLLVQPVAAACLSHPHSRLRPGSGTMYGARRNRGALEPELGRIGFSRGLLVTPRSASFSSLKFPEVSYWVTGLFQTGRSGGGAWGAGAAAPYGGGRGERSAPIRGQFTPVVSPCAGSL